MFQILAGIVGLFAALAIHRLTWTVRLRFPSATSALGILSALGLTGFCLLFLNSDIANMMMVVLAILWAVALLFGALQASALPTAGWIGVAGVFFEMAVAFLTGAAVNLTLQRYIPWLDRRFPEIDVYACINAFLWTMIAALLLLAAIRPLVRLNSTRLAEEKRDSL